jgi:hypothetical protein
MSLNMNMSTSNTTEIISSPCTGVCKMQSASSGDDLCAGCFRTRDEIARWRKTMSEDERLELMFELPARAHLLPPMQANGCGG